jgi:hypothetical protein
MRECLFFMRVVKLIAGLGLVVLAAWAARLATAVFSAYDRFHPREGSGAIVRRTVIFHHYVLSGWKISGAIALLAVCALSFFIAGCWLAFSILREANEKEKDR